MRETKLAVREICHGLESDRAAFRVYYSPGVRIEFKELDLKSRKKIRDLKIAEQTRCTGSVNCSAI